MKVKSTAVVLLVLFSLFGCTSEPKDIPGQKLEAVPGDEVVLYQKKPDNYDIIGTVTLPLTPEMTWNEHGDATKAFNLLKAKAGEIGANGVLFELDNSEYDILATAGYQRKFYQVPIRLKPQRMAVARAIRVNNIDVIPRAVDAGDALRGMAPGLALAESCAVTVRVQI